MRAGGRRYWLLVCLYVVLLFGVQPFLGLAVDAFKERWGAPALEGAVWVAAGLAAVALATVTARLWRRATALERMVLLVGLAAYGLGVARLDIPQERLHYAEYGLLAGLIHVGLQRRWAGGWPRPAVAGMVIAAAAGFLDEMLQGLLWPRRYFDWRDVVLNGQAALLGVAVAVPAWNAWRRRAS